VGFAMMSGLIKACPTTLPNPEEVSMDNDIGESFTNNFEEKIFEFALKMDLINLIYDFIDCLSAFFSF
jgi:hypothetical protein